MKPIIRILSYLKHFPWHIGLNVFFNLLHIVFNLGSYVMIVPFVELLFGLGDIPVEEPAFGFSQEELTGWAFCKCVKPGMYVSRFSSISFCRVCIRVKTRFSSSETSPRM